MFRVETAGEARDQRFAETRFEIWLTAALTGQAFAGKLKSFRQFDLPFRRQEPQEPKAIFEQLKRAFGVTGNTDR